MTPSRSGSHGWPLSTHSRYAGSASSISPSVCHGVTWLPVATMRGFVGKSGDEPLRSDFSGPSWTSQARRRRSGPDGSAGIQRAARRILVDHGARASGPSRRGARTCLRHALRPSYICNVVPSDRHRPVTGGSRTPSMPACWAPSPSFRGRSTCGRTGGPSATRRTPAPASGGPPPTAWSAGTSPRPAGSPRTSRSRPALRLDGVQGDRPDPDPAGELPRGAPARC